MKKYFLLVLFTGITLFAIVDSLSCCYFFETSADRNAKICEPKITSLVNAECTSCKIMHDQGANTWTKGRDCDTSSPPRPEGCTTTGSLTTCYCSTDECNGSNHTSISLLTLLMVLLGNTLL